ncbi:unnamed protein product [Phytomonas sp. Hart1]|nr:unnamed protein product [Phytomonas sp. Hart1]|eukprot:CCW66480.1 unnamed protein product [Phytomonas sp. isolate Hart1]
MESAILLSQVSPFPESATAHAVDCVEALQRQRQAITDEVEKSFATCTVTTDRKNNSKEEVLRSAEDKGDLSPPPPCRMNFLKLHAMHRRRLYLQYAEQFSHLSDSHQFYKLFMWCHHHHLFIHPSVRVVRSRSEFRDHVFFVSEDVPRLTPLLAIPEHLTIGFKDANDDTADSQNNLHDAQRIREFHTLNSGGSASENDTCQFFFNSLGMLVSDLVTAKNSPLSDPRCCFAEQLSKTRTLQNAPYFEDDVVFSPVEPCLADVLLQMIRNYIRGGPLVNKIPMQELQWAVSICLSHSTPLCIDSVRSIGILPIIHAFPHGGEKTNSYLVTRTSRSGASAKMSAFFRHEFGYDFDSIHDGKWIYLLSDRPLKAGEEIHVQAMAPICGRDDIEAQQIWRLSCGSTPSSYKSTAVVAKCQAKLTADILSLGEKYLTQERGGC